MNAEEAVKESRRILESESLDGFIDWDRSNGLDFPDSVYVELIARDASKQEAMIDALAAVPEPVEIEVHPVWRIAGVGKPDVARTASGSIVPATLVIVQMSSGTCVVPVRVLITALAELEIRRLIGREPDLSRVARLHVESLMRWGGASYWDPRQRDLLEITSERAVALYPALKKGA